jgi:hypothetical protein
MMNPVIILNAIATVLIGIGKAITWVLNAMVQYRKILPFIFGGLLIAVAIHYFSIGQTNTAIFSAGLGLTIGGWGGALSVNHPVYGAISGCAGIVMIIITQL